MSSPIFELCWKPEAWKDFDPVIYGAYTKELRRQQLGLELIASENYVSKHVLQACGSIFTNKYAEGYPGRRYYGGCGAYDEVESHAIELVKELFGAAWANVQPHSGANANFGVYFGLLKPGDTILAMDLSSGGHLTHGSPVNISGKWFKAVGYGLDQNNRIDLEHVRKLAKETQPQLIICGATCYPRMIDFEGFASIAKEVGAYLMADIAHIAGLIAAGVHPSPISHCDVVTSTTHKTLRGPRGGLIMGTDPEIQKKIKKAIFPGTQGGPLMHQILGKAVCFREALMPEFKTYGKQVVKNAQALAGGLVEEGLDVITGGTDNHLVWVSLLSVEGLDGKTAEAQLEEAGITTNKNTIPNDPRSPMVTSGIRLGTAACTTREMKESEMVKVSQFIGKALQNPTSQELSRIKGEVEKLCLDFPIYAD